MHADLYTHALHHQHTSHLYQESQITIVIYQAYRVPAYGAQQHHADRGFLSTATRLCCGQICIAVLPKHGGAQITLHPHRLEGISDYHAKPLVVHAALQFPMNIPHLRYHSVPSNNVVDGVFCHTGFCASRLHTNLMIRGRRFLANRYCLKRPRIGNETAGTNPGVAHKN